MTPPDAVSTTPDWSAFTDWEMVLPPNRPGRENLAVIRSLLLDLPRDMPVAVLGTTVEYLRLLESLGFRDVTCIDRSLAFHQSVLLSRPPNDRVRLVVDDWLGALPRHRQRFGCILSDFTHGNLPLDSQPLYFDAIRQALTPTGRFIDRMLTYRRPPYSYGELTRYFEHLPLNLVSLNEFNSRWLFCGERVFEQTVVDTSATYAEGLRRSRDANVRWLLRNCARLSPEGAIWHYGTRWCDLSPAYSRCFVIEREVPEPSWSPYRGWAFIISSRPRWS